MLLGMVWRYKQPLKYVLLLQCLVYSRVHLFDQLNDLIDDVCDELTEH